VFSGWEGLVAEEVASKRLPDAPWIVRTARMQEAHLYGQGRLGASPTDRQRTVVENGWSSMALATRLHAFPLVTVEGPPC
jgi:hypothetical protein